MAEAAKQTAVWPQSGKRRHDGKHGSAGISGFSDHSYGFREGRNAHQAVRHVEACWKEGRRFAVDGDPIDELSRYVTGWLNYFGISETYSQVLELSEWVRRRVRLYYWKQWKQPRTRRRHLLALGIPREEGHMATRSRKGYWRISASQTYLKFVSG